MGPVKGCPMNATNTGRGRSVMSDESRWRWDRREWQCGPALALYHHHQLDPPDRLGCTSISMFSPLLFIFTFSTWYFTTVCLYVPTIFSSKHDHVASTYCSCSFLGQCIFLATLAPAKARFTRTSSRNTLSFHTTTLGFAAVRLFSDL